MKPLLYVIFQLVVLGWAGFAVIRRDPSRLYRVLWFAALCGVVGFDVWYLADYAYPAGFQF